MSSPRPDQAPARGPKPRLSRQQIIDAALEMLEDHEASAMRLRDLSGRLGVGVMTLYGYFGSRERLEEALVEAVMPHPASEDDLAWDESLRRLVLDIRDVYVRYPGVAEIMASRSMESAAVTRLREQALELISRSGLTPIQTVWAAGVVGNYIMGFAQARGRHDQARDDARAAQYASSESDVLQRFASLYAEHTSTDAMAFGIDVIIRGLRALADQPG